MKFKVHNTWLKEDTQLSTKMRQSKSSVDCNFHICPHRNVAAVARNWTLELYAQKQNATDINPVKTVHLLQKQTKYTDCSYWCKQTYMQKKPIKILLNIFISEGGLEEKVLWKILKKMKVWF